MGVKGICTHDLRSVIDFLSKTAAFAPSLQSLLTPLVPARSARARAIPTPIMRPFGASAHTFPCAAGWRHMGKPHGKAWGGIDRCERPGGKDARRPVSRVLSGLLAQPWTAIPLGCRLRGTSRDQPGRRGGNALASRGSRRAAGRPYSVLLPVGFTLPALLPARRCALTAPFHPYPWALRCRGGLFSVALSLGSPPPAVSRHRIPVEPGLSSPRLLPRARSGRPAVWPGADAPAFPCGQAMPCRELTSRAARCTVCGSARPETSLGRQWR